MGSGVNIRLGDNVTNYERWEEANRQIGTNEALVQRLTREAKNLPIDKLWEWGKQSPYHADIAMNVMEKRAFPELDRLTEAQRRHMKTEMMR
jgi:hypothetical protein